MAELEERVGKLENRVTAIETAQPYLRDLLDRTIKSQEAMTEAISSIKTTLVEMNNKIDAQDAKLDERGKEIKAVSEKVDKIEDKGKVDFLGYLKSNWYWIAIVLGLGITQAAQYFRF